MLYMIILYLYGFHLSLSPFISFPLAIPSGIDDLSFHN